MPHDFFKWLVSSCHCIKQFFCCVLFLSSRRALSYLQGQVSIWIIQFYELGDDKLPLGLMSIFALVKKVHCRDLPRGKLLLWVFIITFEKYVF